jgi:hypothetical protein
LSITPRIRAQRQNGRRGRPGNPIERRIGLSKHFCCNNQEFERTQNDSRVSERALREIYLKGFEICVKEAGPRILMTSYNRLNGVWNHYNYELVTGILRGEWGFPGNVITDWWMVQAESPEFPGLRTHAYRVRAQVDVFMRATMPRRIKTIIPTAHCWRPSAGPKGSHAASSSARPITSCVLYLRKSIHNLDFSARGKPYGILFIMPLPGF